VIGNCHRRHRHQEFLKFMDLVDSKLPAEAKEVSVAAKKGTSLAVEKEPAVRLRYVRRQGQQIGKERILASLKPFWPHLWFDRRDRTCL
jgi:hypothetical protein